MIAIHYAYSRMIVGELSPQKALTLFRNKVTNLQELWENRGAGYYYLYDPMLKNIHENLRELDRYIAEAEALIRESPPEPVPDARAPERKAADLTDEDCIKRLLYQRVRTFAKNTGLQEDHYGIV
jgi:hypothetical protein